MIARWALVSGSLAAGAGTLGLMWRLWRYRERPGAAWFLASLSAQVPGFGPGPFEAARLEEDDAPLVVGRDRQDETGSAPSIRRPLDATRHTRRPNTLEAETPR